MLQETVLIPFIAVSLMSGAISACVLRLNALKLNADSNCGTVHCSDYAKFPPDRTNIRWYIDSDGSFLEPELGKPGILLRPEDYDCVYVLPNEETKNV